MEACEERITLENCGKIAKAIGVDLADIIDFESKYKFVENIKSNDLLIMKNEKLLLLEEINELKKCNNILIRLLDKFSN